VIASAQLLTERRVWTMAQAYCVKCKKKVEIQNPKQIIMKSKRPATKGVCPKMPNHGIPHR
jgi:hypothetical protein